MRDGSIELRKVRGEANPADLFTKHLTSQERVTTLLKLFGCGYTEGRAATAPKLRQGAGRNEQGKLHMSCGGTGGFPKTEVDGEWVDEAHLHDERWLPHLAGLVLDQFFPRAEAAVDLGDCDPPHEDALRLHGTTLGRRRAQDETFCDACWLCSGLWELSARLCRSF